MYKKPKQALIIQLCKYMNSCTNFVFLYTVYGSLWLYCVNIKSPKHGTKIDQVLFFDAFGIDSTSYPFLSCISKASSLPDRGKKDSEKRKDGSIYSCVIAARWIGGGSNSKHTRKHGHFYYTYSLAVMHYTIPRSLVALCKC